LRGSGAVVVAQRSVSKFSAHVAFVTERASELSVAFIELALEVQKGWNGVEIRMLELAGVGIPVKNASIHAFSPSIVADELLLVIQDYEVRIFQHQLRK